MTHDVAAETNFFRQHQSTMWCKTALTLIIWFSSSQICLSFQQRVLAEGRIHRPSSLQAPFRLNHPRTSLSVFPDALTGIFPNGLPFDEIGKQLSENLSITNARVPEAATSMVLESIGRDLLVFLSASVVVTPVASALGITPILGYLIAGAALGPHGLDVFSNSQADVELGDFGILFLLFSEGLEVSQTRLEKLANYLPLGFAQISLTAASLTAGILWVDPFWFQRFLPLDAGLINIQNPIEALVLALAGALSTSAFIFPVLKERGWEEEDSGQAATSILLLQDLFVAPLLVLMPYVVGQGVTDYTAIGFLTAKATLGFGSVIFVGSFVLSRLFRLVAQTRSTETFVALSLLVSVGMGAIATSLGLTDTAGAFAAGVLLANTNYRSQIQADILPFKGILLGIFFMGAGSSFDTDLVVREWPTILVGSATLVFTKAITLGLATRIPKRLEPNRLSGADGIRVSLLLAGGGEFAFVVLAAAQKLGVLPEELNSLLTAMVLITMSITPILGEVAVVASEQFVRQKGAGAGAKGSEEAAQEVSHIASDAIVVCGFGEVAQSVVSALAKKEIASPEQDDLSSLVIFDSDPAFLMSDARSADTEVLFGDPSNPEVLRSNGVTHPRAIFITYDEHSMVLSATSRLHIAFGETPIYTRAQTRSEAQSLRAAGATEVIIESDELARSAPVLVRSATMEIPTFASTPRIGAELRRAAANAANVPEDEVDGLLEMFSSIDQDGSGLVDADELLGMVSKSNAGLATDQEVLEMDVWLHQVVPSRLDAVEFCRLYVSAPAVIQEGLRNACSY